MSNKKSIEGAVRELGKVRDAARKDVSLFVQAVVDGKDATASENMKNAADAHVRANAYEALIKMLKEKAGS